MAWEDRRRDGRLDLLTDDHTWVNEQLHRGYLDATQARAHSLKNIVTRAIGGDADFRVDVREVEARAGDIFLLCSDGLTAMLEDRQINRLLSAIAVCSLSTRRRLIACVRLTLKRPSRDPRVAFLSVKEHSSARRQPALNGEER